MSIKKRAIFIGIIIGIVLLSSILSIVIMRQNLGSGTIAYIYQDNVIIRKIDLSKVDEPYEVRIDAKNGGYNILRIEKGKIGVIEASCPDLLCKNMGFISNSLMPITCLPNHMVIVVKIKETAPNELDGVAY